MAKKETALVKAEASELAKPVDEQTIKDFLFSSGTKLTEQQMALFVQLAVRNQLDPFKREIYAVPYGNDFNVLTGYEVYIRRAERTGKLTGWHAWTVGSKEEGNLKAVVEIHRSDWAEPFLHEVDFEEYDLKRNLWNNKPKTMIKKVAISQGFRMCFSEELAGMPYTTDEIDTEPKATQVAKTEQEGEYEVTSVGPREEVVEAEVVEEEPAPILDEPSPVKYITPAQVTKFWTVAKKKARELKITDEDLEARIKVVLITYGIEDGSVKKIPADLFEEFLEAIESIKVGSVKQESERTQAVEAAGTEQASLEMVAARDVATKAILEVAQKNCQEFAEKTGQDWSSLWADQLVEYEDIGIKEANAINRYFHTKLKVTE